MTGKTIAVIGAGPSGITAIKNFSDLGFRVTGFERCAGVGGNWRFDDPSGHSSVFETTHIISSKYTSFYEDFPFDDDAPDYPSHEYLLDYFTRYAEHFGVDKCVKFGTEVVHCKPISDGRWMVSWRKLNEETVVEQEFDALVVCNGHHHKPRMPDYPGEFSGEFIHSHDFKRAEPFRDKRVLVIGGGNSACDVAVETSRVSERTVISWRRGYHLLPKFILGMPVDKFVASLSWMPLPLRFQLPGLKALLWVLQGSNKNIGLPAPDHQLLATHPTLNSELYYYIRHGKIFPKGDIERFDGKMVQFKDGGREEFDTIVACTGFQITHPFFDKDLIDFSSGPPRLFHKMIPENPPNLYFIGLFQPLGCIWPGAELQSKLAARHYAKLWKPRGNLGKLIEKELRNPDVKQVDSPRHTITVDDLAFRNRLRGELRRAKKVSIYTHAA